MVAWGRKYRNTSRLPGSGSPNHPPLPGSHDRQTDPPPSSSTPAPRANTPPTSCSASSSSASSATGASPSAAMPASRASTSPSLHPARRGGGGVLRGRWWRGGGQQRWCRGTGGGGSGAGPPGRRMQALMRKGGFAPCKAVDVAAWVGRCRAPARRRDAPAARAVGPAAAAAAAVSAVALGSLVLKVLGVLQGGAGRAGSRVMQQGARCWVSKYSASLKEGRGGAWSKRGGTRPNMKRNAGLLFAGARRCQLRRGAPTSARSFSVCSSRAATSLSSTCGGARATGWGGVMMRHAPVHC